VGSIISIERPVAQPWCCRTGQVARIAMQDAILAAELFLPRRSQSGL
jgi:hypothetical protein